MKITTEYIKNKKRLEHTYSRYHVSSVDYSLLLLMVKQHEYNSHGRYYNKINRYFDHIRVGGRVNLTTTYDEIYCGFDIETTRIDDNASFMYGWQFSINNNVIWGETWEQFRTFLDFLCDTLKGAKSHRLIVWVANLNFEWTYMNHWLNITNFFFKDVREPIMVEHNEFIQFRECLSWGKGLSKLAQDYTDLSKLTGDIDYSKYRESYRDFTNEREWAYIDFDVLILAQFSKWFFKTYIHNNLCPVTIQSALRNKMIQIADGQSLKNCLPRTYEEYKTLMNNVYRGGYVHSNQLYVNQLIDYELIWSYDYTSSYPAVMLVKKYGYEFIEVVNVDLKKVIETLDRDMYTFYGEFHFVNIRRTTAHSIESISKCKLYGSYTVDNGRVATATYMNTWLFADDLDSYNEFYEWDRMEVSRLYVAKLDYLPRYMIDVLGENYTKKAILKKQHMNYTIEKEYTNCAYGVCCTKETECDYIMNDDGVVVKQDKNMDVEWAKKRKDKYNKVVILPQFGCQISAYARRNLLSTIYKLEKSGNPCLYSDTDSIKFFNRNNGKDIIKQYNEQQQALIKERCEAYNLDYDIYWDLGSFDCEYEKGIRYFKTLGAKRYLHAYVKDGNMNYECTIAGLPKKVYKDRHTPKYNYKEFFKPFHNKMVEDAVKLGATYTTEPFEIFRLGRKEIVYGCLTLNNTDFTLKADDDWLAEIMEMIHSGKEVRFYG